LQNSRFALTWFALGLTLTTATQLRAGGAGAGPGELLLAAWIVWSSFILAAHRRFDRSALVTSALAFWLVALSALSFGFISYAANNPPVDASHDAPALLFAAFLLLAFVAPSDPVTRFTRTVPLFLILSLVPLLSLWLAGLFVPTVGPFSLWYGSRFVGWAENPNQVALLTTPAPFLCGYLATSLRGWRRWGAASLGIAAVVVGLASQSDALRVSWIITAVFLVVAGWFRVAAGARTRALPAVIAFGIIPVALVITGLSLGAEVLQGALDFGTNTYEQDDQGADRVDAWANGAKVILASPLFGRGPGAHAGEASNSDPMEAHNTLIDWGTSSGFVGLAAYVALLTWSTLTVWRRGRLLLLSALTALFVFSMFGYVLRQPMYWFYLLGAVALSSPQSSAHMQRQLQPR
jgi:O-antigen ligase